MISEVIFSTVRITLEFAQLKSMTKFELSLKAFDKSVSSLPLRII